MTSPATPTSAHPLFARCFFKIFPYIWTSCSHFFTLLFFLYFLFFFFPTLQGECVLSRPPQGGVKGQTGRDFGSRAPQQQQQKQQQHEGLEYGYPRSIHTICHPAANSPLTPGYKNTQMWCCGHKNTNSSLRPPLHNSFSSFSLFVHRDLGFFNFVAGFTDQK